MIFSIAQICCVAFQHVPPIFLTSLNQNRSRSIYQVFVFATTTSGIDPFMVKVPAHLTPLFRVRGFKESNHAQSVTGNVGKTWPSKTAVCSPPSGHVCAWIASQVQRETVRERIGCPNIGARIFKHCLGVVPCEKKRRTRHILMHHR